MNPRPLLRYHGGKWLLAPLIIEYFPKHRTYVEPYCGAASVLMRKPRSYAEVINDLYDETINVFSVMRDKEKANELRRLLKLTPFSRKEFRAAFKPSNDEIERARRTIVRSYMGFGSAATNINYSHTGFRANSNRSGTTPAHDWVNYPSHIDRFTDRLQGVVIECRPAIELIGIQDSPETLFYVDPPYVKSTRQRRVQLGDDCYAHEMTDENHLELLSKLISVKGYVVLSCYDTPMYQDILKGWRRVEIATFADGARPRTEVLYLSPKTDKALDTLFDIRS